MIDEFNKDITALGAAAILENITSKSNIGGQSLIGTMRESRNAARMQLSGTSLDNTIIPRFETFEFDNETYTPKVVKVGNVSVVKITGDPSIDQYNASIYGSYRDWETDRKSTRLNSSHSAKSRMPSSA